MANKDSLQPLVENLKWLELVEHAKEVRQGILESIVRLTPNSVETFLTREQLIGQANAIMLFADHIIQQQEQVKEEQQTEEPAND